MGEIADDMIYGSCCSECSHYFIEETGEVSEDGTPIVNVHEHGYPVLCKDCWNRTPPAKRKKMGLQKALYD